MPGFSASSQDYLETILQLSKEGEQVRSVDIAAALGVSRASVSRALNLLKRSGFIEKEHYSGIRITESGIIAGRAVAERHQALLTFLVDILGVSPDVAEEDACRMEHSLSIESLSKLQEFLNSRG